MMRCAALQLAGKEDEALATVNAKVSLDPRIIEQHMRRCDLAEIYGGAPGGSGSSSHNARTSEAQVLDASQVPLGPEPLTYQQLMEAPTMAKAVELVVQVRRPEPGSEQQERALG